MPTSAPEPSLCAAGMQPLGGVWLEALRFHLAADEVGAYRFSHIRLPYGAAVPCLTDTLKELLTGRTIGEVLAQMEGPNRPCLPAAELRSYLVSLARQMNISIHSPMAETAGVPDCGCAACARQETPPA